MRFSFFILFSFNLFKDHGKLVEVVQGTDICHYSCLLKVILSAGALSSFLYFFLLHPQLQRLPIHIWVSFIVDATQLLPMTDPRKKRNTVQLNLKLIFLQCKCATLTFDHHVTDTDHYHTHEPAALNQTMESQVNIWSLRALYLLTILQNAKKRKKWRWVLFWRIHWPNQSKIWCYKERLFWFWKIMNNMAMSAY